MSIGPHFLLPFFPPASLAEAFLCLEAPSSKNAASSGKRTEELRVEPPRKEAMESSNLSALQEEGSEGQPPSAFSPDSIPPRPASQSSLDKYSPLEWSDYFDKEEDVTILGTNNVFHVYMAGSKGPVVFCLHGGGYSGLSFALSASKIKERAQVVAMDLRGHGMSSTDNDLDLSIETLCNDVLAVLKTIYGNSPPAIILVGHSMGGSVAVHVAASKAMANVHGLVVVDVVEGTTMASLVHMQKILSNRMQHFPTIEKAYGSGGGAIGRGGWGGEAAASKGPGGSETGFGAGNSGWGDSKRVVPPQADAASGWSGGSGSGGW